MNILLNIIITAIITVATTVGVYNYVPHSWIPDFSGQLQVDGNLGAFTEIASSDSISSFPTIYNAHLAKTIETGSTTIDAITDLENLSVIGTITTGIWNGSTTRTVYGGTGSSTLAFGKILLGNGADGVSIVNGF